MPFCANCGREVSPAALACPNCGHPGPGAGTDAASQTKRTEGFAIASLVCGIVGLVGVPLVGSILAIVFASAARKRIAQDPELTGADLARAGKILGWIGLILGLLFVLFVIVVAFGVSNSNF